MRTVGGPPDHAGFRGQRTGPSDLDACADLPLGHRQCPLGKGELRRRGSGCCSNRGRRRKLGRAHSGGRLSFGATGAPRSPGPPRQQPWTEAVRQPSTPPAPQPRNCRGRARHRLTALRAASAASALVSLRVGDADRACHCAISSVANAADVSMRSVAWITSRAWSRYATKARAAAKAMPKTMRTGLDRRVARGRVAAVASASNASLVNNGSSIRRARATAAAGCAAAAAAPRRRSSIGGTVISGHASVSGSRSDAIAGGARLGRFRSRVFAAAQHLRPGDSEPRQKLGYTRRPPLTPQREASRSACHCGSGRPGTGCGARPAVKASSGELPLYGWRRARSSYARHASPYTSSLGCG